MKTTLELPDDLMRAIKVRAAQQDRKIKDVVTELLRRALSQPESAATAAAPRRVRLPLVQCDTAFGSDMTPDRVAAVLLGEEADWSGRSGDAAV
ncbi:antitoxin [Mycobacterium sp. M1]|uniref:Antitoxin n=1 Tax=Mycolicibacter acidiphilus TaxID=2835306 RepID=A0ABS5RJ49_9MYCO|nr:antitoxin [Mycolicibacter acidiphilus]MBS9534224.1 antitoxin [Mycolicibacter acidiphilus]